MRPARDLYRRFFNRYPNLKNPTNINCEEKYLFAIDIGWENLRAMRIARKQGHEWTKRSYWVV